MKKSRANSQVSEGQHEVEVMMWKMLRDLCTTQQAAEILGINQDSVFLLISRKRISAVKLGNTWIVYKPSLLEYLKRKSRKGKPPSHAPKIRKVGY